MIIGVTGDTHNNLKNISIICDLFNKLRPSLVIHTGDITLQKSLAKFSKLKMPLIGVYGNNDEEEKEGLNEETKKFECELFDEPHLLKIDNKITKKSVDLNADIKDIPVSIIEIPIKKFTLLKVVTK